METSCSGTQYKYYRFPVALIPHALPLYKRVDICVPPATIRRGNQTLMNAARRTPVARSSRRRCKPRILLLLCLSWLLLDLWPGLSVLGQQRAREESCLLGSARWITPVTLLSIPTPTGPGVRLEYGAPCMAEGGTRVRKLVHHFASVGSCWCTTKRRTR